jgi:hypothetical protein
VARVTRVQDATGRRTGNGRSRLTVVAAIPLLGFAAAFVLCSACGGGNALPSGGTPTPVAGGGTAERPLWFPASFPLPVNTVVLEDKPADSGGGEVRFRAPVPLDESVKIFDLNLESHGYAISDRSQSADSAAFTFESADFTGAVSITPDGSASLYDVKLTPK